jgi:hypothetical protein
MPVARRSIFAMTSICILSALASQPAQGQDKEHSVQIVPSDLFTGDLKRLEPHLGLTTGCVKLKYEGPETPMHYVVQVWREGQWKDLNHNKMGTLKGDDEISISVREAVDDGKRKYQVVVARSNVEFGSTRTTMYVDPPASTMRASAREQLQRTLDVKTPGEVVVWAWKKGTGEKFSLAGRGPVEERATRSAEWALALKLVFDKR